MPSYFSLLTFLFAGKSEIPFEIPLRSRPDVPLYETYHGVVVNIQYQLRVDIKRSAFSKDMTKSMEFFVELSGKKDVSLCLIIKIEDL